MFLQQMGKKTAAGKAGEASAPSGCHLIGVTKVGCVSPNHLFVQGLETPAAIQQSSYIGGRLCLVPSMSLSK